MGRQVLISLIFVLFTTRTAMAIINITENSAECTGGTYVYHINVTHSEQLKPGDGFVIYGDFGKAALSLAADNAASLIYFNLVPHAPASGLHNTLLCNYSDTDYAMRIEPIQLTADIASEKLMNGNKGNSSYIPNLSNNPTYVWTLPANPSSVSGQLDYTLTITGANASTQMGAFASVYSMSGDNPLPMHVCLMSFGILDVPGSRGHRFPILPVILSITVATIIGIVLIVAIWRLRKRYNILRPSIGNVIADDTSD